MRRLNGLYCRFWHLKYKSDDNSQREREHMIQAADGKLGVMTVGMGGVATTLIAGHSGVKKLWIECS